MDTSFWNKLNPSIKIHSTHKQYYGKYLWRVLLKVQGGRLIYSKIDNLDIAIQNRRDHEHRMVNWAGSWLQRKRLSPSVDRELLERFREYHKNNKHVRIRVEEPNIQVYAETEVELKNFVQHFSQYPEIFREVHGVFDSVQEQILKSDKIITRVPNKWRYKVLFREGVIDAQIKLSILAYLDNLGDQVQVSESIRHQLERPYNTLWGGFIYLNDDSIITFINIMSPGLVRKIHELVYLDE